MRLADAVKAATGLGGLPEDNSAFAYPQMFIVLFGMRPVATWEGMQKGIRVRRGYSRHPTSVFGPDWKYELFLAMKGCMAGCMAVLLVATIDRLIAVTSIP